MANSVWERNLSIFCLRDQKLHGPRTRVQRFQHPNRQICDAVEQVRRLVGHLSIACDFTKGGDTTTAIAIQKYLQRPVYRISSNTGTSTTARFLNEILQTAYSFVYNPFANEQAETTARAVLEDDLFYRITGHIHERLRSYVKRLQHAIREEKQDKKRDLIAKQELRGKSYHPRLPIAFTLRRQHSILCISEQLHGIL